MLLQIEISDALNRGFQCATIQLDFQLPQNFGLEYMAGDNPAKSEKTEKGEKAIPRREKGSKPASKGVEAVETKSETKSDPKAGKSEPSDAKSKDEPSKPKPLTAGHARPVMIHRAIIGSFERFLAIITEHFAGKWPFWLSPRQVLVVPVMPEANSYAVEVQQLLHKQRFYADVDISGNTMPKKILRGQQAQYNFIFGTFMASSFNGVRLLTDNSCWCPGARISYG